MVTSKVAQEMQNMTHWGGVGANVQCTIASCSKLRAIATEREKNQAEMEHELSAPEQVRLQTSMEEMMNKMMTGIFSSVDERLNNK